MSAGKPTLLHAIPPSVALTHMSTTANPPPHGSIWSFSRMKVAAPYASKKSATLAKGLSGTAADWHRREQSRAHEGKRQWDITRARGGISLGLAETHAHARAYGVWLGVAGYLAPLDSCSPGRAPREIQVGEARMPVGVLVTTVMVMADMVVVPPGRDQASIPPRSRHHLLGSVATGSVHDGRATGLFRFGRDGRCGSYGWHGGVARGKLVRLAGVERQQACAPQTGQANEQVVSVPNTRGRATRT